MVSEHELNDYFFEFSGYNFLYYNSQVFLCKFKKFLYVWNAVREPFRNAVRIMDHTPLYKKH